MCVCARARLRVCKRVRACVRACVRVWHERLGGAGLRHASKERRDPDMRGTYICGACRICGGETDSAGAARCVLKRVLHPARGIDRTLVRDLKALL